MFSPVVVLKPTRHRGNFPKASRHNAPVHEISGFCTSRSVQIKQSDIFSKAQKRK
jgi:hypothetical protein